MDGRLKGAEVLLRWDHSIRGLVQPIDFFPLSQITGLILPLDLRVLETVCGRLAAWARDFLAASGCSSYLFSRPLPLAA